MPNLIGQNFLDAKQNIEKAGFQVERIYTPTQDAVQDGKVATQNPVAGQQVFSDSKITLTTYQVASIKMPKLVGLTFAQALEALEKIGFSSNMVSISSQPVNDQKLAEGIIDTQAPAPGETIDRIRFQSNNMMIRLQGRVYLKVNWVKVPNVLNIKEDEAKKRLEGAGLRPIVNYKGTGAKNWDGVVLDQKPGAGTEVIPDSSVNLTAYKYNSDTIQVSMKLVEKQHYLLGVTGGALPYDVTAQYDVPANLKGTEVVQISLLQDSPSSPGWKWYRILTKIPLKATLVVKDNKGQVYKYAMDLTGQ